MVASYQSISIKDFVREKKFCNRKKRAAETFLMQLNTKPLKFKCELAGGKGWWLEDPCKARVPHLVPNKNFTFFALI
jgi:hypothetical protein